MKYMHKFTLLWDFCYKFSHSNRYNIAELSGNERISFCNYLHQSCFCLFYI